MCFGERKPLRRVNLGVFGQYTAKRLIHSHTPLLEAELCHLPSALTKSETSDHGRGCPGGYGA